MYTVDLTPTDEYNAREVALIASTWLSGCVGICTETKEEALRLAENALEGETETKGEIGVYYNLVAVELEEED